MAHIIEIIIFIYFAMSVFEPRFKKWVFPIFFLCLYWAPLSLLYSNYDNTWFRIPITMLSALLMVCIFFKDKFSKKFVYLFIYVACALVQNIIIVLALSVLNIDVESVKSSRLAMAMLQLFIVPFEFTYMILIIKFSKRNTTPVNTSVLQNIILFIMSQILLYNVIIEVFFYYHISSRLMVVLLSVSIALSMLFGILIYISIAKMYREKQQEQSMFEQSMYQAEKYETLKTAYMDYHRLRHDFYDHISVLDSLKVAGNEEKLNNYITQMKTDFENLENIVFCDNTAVDMLVGNRARTAQEKGIRTEFSLKDTVSCGIDDMDLCSIFSNLLNNAIRGTEEFDGDKYIVMQSYVKAGCFVITCRNSSDMPELDMKTTKADKDKHGFGIQIIKNVSKKLGGNAVFEYDNNEFVSAVTIPITST